MRIVHRWIAFPVLLAAASASPVTYEPGIGLGEARACAQIDNEPVQGHCCFQVNALCITGSERRMNRYLKSGECTEGGNGSPVP